VPDAAYWEELAAAGDPLPAGWRRHARRVHVDLAGEWGLLDARRGLKTDVQEETSPHRSMADAFRGQWVAVDISAGVAQRARQSSAACSIPAVADVRRLPFRRGCFDRVISTSTLDHFDARSDLEEALVELRRVLEDGGLMLLTMDNAANPLIRVRNALPHWLSRRTGLVPFFVGETVDEDDGRALLARVGFDVLATRHLLHAPHMVGTRLARFRWYEDRVLPRWDRLAGSRVARFSGHFVAFLVTPR
jgi:ubiquinone/menaquinone biosynthesis C-methylase UbiE